MRKILAAVVLVAGCGGDETPSVPVVRKVTLYNADGVPVRQWRTTEAFYHDLKRTTYKFSDLATGRSVEVTGTVVVEQE